MIGIIDYGAGNIHSIQKAFNFLKKDNIIVSRDCHLKSVKRLVLPGVGSFGHAVGKLKKTGFLEPVQQWIQAGKPFLGICLGLQMLFEKSEESARTFGLAVFKGNCRKFKAKKVPQIGWNTIQIQKRACLLDGIKDGEYFYFVHSYYVFTPQSEIVHAVTDYGLDYASISGIDRIWGVQFHPEKSGPPGLKLLKNWVEKC